MANYVASDTDLTAVANAIRTKGGTSAQLEFPTGFANAIDAIPTGITPTGTKNINTNGTHDVTNYASANVAVPASAVDSGTKNITSNGNNQDVVGYAAVNVAVPNSYSASDEGKVVSNGALVAQTSDTVTQNGVVDTTLINSLTVNVSGGGEEDLKNLIERDLTTLTNTDATSIGHSAFRNMSSLTSVSIPNATTVAANAFTSCSNLATVNLPSLTTMTGGNIFEGIKAQYLVFPNLTSAGTGSYNFRNNTTLKGFDCKTFGTLQAASFENDSSFDTLIIRNSAICALANVSAFRGTKFASGGAGGTIYIPKSLYDHLGDNSNLDYKKATNWSTMDGYGTITWEKIEGSTYETHYVDGTSIS